MNLFMRCCVLLRRNNSPTDRTMKVLHIFITTTIWLRQPTLFVVGYQDLEALGHCQKSGCRNSPDRAEEEADNGNHRGYGGSRVKKYVAEHESQTESQPVISPGEFILIFIILLMALHIKRNGLASIQAWYDKFCHTARRSLISLRAKSSGKGGVVVATAGIRSKLVSTSASLGSLVDLIGPGSEHDDLHGFDKPLGGNNIRRARDESNYSNSSIDNVLNDSFRDVLSHSLRGRLSRIYSSGSLGGSSCNSSQASSFDDKSGSFVEMNVFADSSYDSYGASSDVERGVSAESVPFRATEFARRASMDPPEGVVNEMKLLRPQERSDSDTVMATTDMIPASIKIGGRKKQKNKIDSVDKTVLSKFCNNLTEKHRPVSNRRQPSIARSIDDNCSMKPSRRSTVDTALLSRSSIR